MASIRDGPTEVGTSRPSLMLSLTAQRSSLPPIAPWVLHAFRFCHTLTRPAAGFAALRPATCRNQLCGAWRLPMASTFGHRGPDWGHVRRELTNVVREQ